MRRRLLLTAILAVAPAAAGPLYDSFRRPPAETRPMVRWWWFGPAVSEAELEREMRLMRAGGFGGFEVQPVYPLQVEGNLPYLSKEFLAAVRYTAKTARRLGLRMDMTVGSGWPFGGPWISPELAAQRIRPGGPRPTGQQVKRAAVGAEGPVLDHYSRAALDRHLETAGEKLAQAAGTGGIEAMFCDSLEVYGADWTGDLAQEFRKRRGYDLDPEALLRGGSGLRHDWGQTLTELLDERFLAPFQEWCHRKGARSRVQAYGTPPATLSSYRYVDIPEGEGGGGLPWNGFTAVRWASSAAHLLGRPVVSVEAWTWIHSPVFRATPLDFKAEADQLFLEGANQFVAHGWPYSPPPAGEPGWYFYAAGAVNEHNPWWPVMPELTGYVQRLSWLLRQGEPAPGVAVYAPVHDAYARFEPGRVELSAKVAELLGPALIPRLLAAGYSVDLFDDGMLAEAARRYRAIVLPNIERMPPETARGLREFAARGGAVIATRRAPEGVRAVVVPDESALPEALARAAAPEVTFSPEAPAVGFVHRRTPAADIFFLANTSNLAVRATPRFGGKTGRREMWDPFTGAAAAMPGDREIEIEPYGSRVIVFGESTGRPAPTGAPAANVRTIDLTQRWAVEFAGGRMVESEAPWSWSDDPATRYYSGRAVYRTTFDLPAARSVTLSLGEGKPVEPGRQRGFRAWLEGPVREAADVFVNGTHAGAIWHPPYELDITGFARGGSNALEIAVYNLAINGMAGKPLPGRRPLIEKFGERFTDQDLGDLRPLPSGLLGPVQIRMVTR